MKTHSDRPGQEQWASWVRVNKMKRLFILIAGMGMGYAIAFGVPQSIPSFSLDGFNCAAPSGALYAIHYQEIFMGKMHDLKFSCFSLMRNVCRAYFCTEFTAIDKDGKHVIGYVWRDVMNEPQA